MSTNDEITRTEAAEIAGVTPGTWSAYVARGQAPAPARHIGRTPLWSRAQVTAWQAARRGPGRWGPRNRDAD